MIVLCTGCRSGFGLRIAVTAAKAGHTVYAGLRDLSTRADLDAASEGLDVRPIQLDVVQPDQRDAAIQQILSTHGHLDALVNNAGISMGGFQEQLDEAELRRLFEVNVFAPWALTKAVLPHMRERRSGAIINISSMSGTAALPGVGAYASSKFALEGMTEALRYEMRPFGVRVVLVQPGPYATDIFTRNLNVAAATREDAGPYQFMADRLQKLLEGRKQGDPQEVADHVTALLTHPNPKLRYPMGPTVALRRALRKLLPYPAYEAIIRRVLGF